MTLLIGDCIEQMRTLEADSVDAIVTDPPYGLEFMGKDWDGFGTPLGFQTWSEQWAREALRVLKPGGHLLAFGGTRMYHRLAAGIEDAGFEIRDTLMWLYGSGFPKSLDVSKAIDKANGEAGRLLKFTQWFRAAGVARSQASLAMFQAGHISANGTMANHYYAQTVSAQPAIPTPEIWATLRPLCADVPAWVDELVARIAAEREVTGEKAGTHAVNASGLGGAAVGVKQTKVTLEITAPSTEAAKKWQGWGTALKPAVEPIVLARKPLIGTVAENVLTHGTGALNIDASRIGTDGGGTNCSTRDATGQCTGHQESNGSLGGGVMRHGQNTSAGRWPANILLDEEAAALLDEQSGVSKSPAPYYQQTKSKGINAPETRGDVQSSHHGDSGGASRFFYVAKASRSERNKGLERNIHPTVKPVDLMRYLIRLVTPKGGTVLDPFLGSGTTAVAAIEEGVEWIGCEREPEYVEIIKARVAAAQPGMDLR
jgi:site-specific DNA-methyltransferase (adenine-specific)